MIYSRDNMDKGRKRKRGLGGACHRPAMDLGVCRYQGAPQHLAVDTRCKAVLLLTTRRPQVWRLLRKALGKPSADVRLRPVDAWLWEDLGWDGALTDVDEGDDRVLELVVRQVVLVRETRLVEVRLYRTALWIWRLGEWVAITQGQQTFSESLRRRVAQHVAYDRRLDRRTDLRRLAANRYLITQMCKLDSWCTCVSHTV